MYNVKTEKLIREVPKIGQLEMERLPQELTKIYAKIVGIRRTLEPEQDNLPKSFKKNIKLLRTLATNLETLVLLDKENKNRQSSAFVAATAQHLLSTISKKNNSGQQNEKFTANSIPSEISAMILFLISNSPADACELAKKMEVDFPKESVSYKLFKALGYLSTGELEKLQRLEIEENNYEEVYEEAVWYLYELIFKGVHNLALLLLGEAIDKDHQFFSQVIELSRYEFGSGTQSNFSGPYHLASLLEALREELILRGVVSVAKPYGVEEEQWIFFLKRLALDRPYLWENHADAIATGYLEFGNSAVLTFPTGAGKTTLSELKIATTLFLDKSVLYLVPTHALEDQVNKNLKDLFEGLGNSFTIEIGGEYTELFDELPTIAVMTPERCLTLLSVSPDFFSEIGLVVFDEFHLISGRDNSLERRSLDAMFCLLRLFSELPSADYLLISAMVENGGEICDWIEKVTGKNCYNFNSNWKPTRQLHGCVIFKEEEINDLKQKLRTAKREANTKSPSAALRRELKAEAYQIFSLKNMWETNARDDYYMSSLLPSKVLLAAGNFYWNLTSNRNEVAAELALHFGNLGIKTLVFVDQPGVTVSTAQKIIKKVTNPVNFKEIHKKFRRELNTLELELGDLIYSHFVGEAPVAVHHGLMLPIERRLNEQFYKEVSGPNIVVATATLAQGINMPAEIVIIAGDDRFDEELDARETVGPHEILNAAGRAGRAGSAAQGVVLIIPGEVVTFDEDSRLGDRWWHLKNTVFSKSDQCVIITDPLNDLLDSLTDVENLSENQKNIIFRLSLEEDNYNSVVSVFKNSFAASKQGNENESSIEKGIQKLIEIKNSLAFDLLYDPWVENVSLKMAVEPKIVEDLGKAIDEISFEQLFEFDVMQLIDFLFDWLDNNAERIDRLFTARGAKYQMARALNLDKEGFTLEEIAENFSKLKPILQAYLGGSDYFVIEGMITGRSDNFLLKARHFILKLVPHFSFAFGVFSITAREKWNAEDEEADEIPDEIKLLATLIREGFDSVEKLNYKLENSRIGRVELHNSFAR
ncbi:DEAD/DEAH box helicase [Flavobacterium sp. MDT1-60]|uniref:DEAD/DEAH box helicase n=1 Tax=Flavobacterium sp. MDT1-60 TaxID=1979344 RepID=UPI00177C508B|nr:DEAD/DEAH box helicase [Flavobacterium sp. MDT1-60]QOG01078.1 DEAD/DEAH box helicase [Flavobacterium sp. MDT1-60]